MCSIMGFTKLVLDENEVWAYFNRTQSRGPDLSRVEPAGEGSCHLTLEEPMRTVAPGQSAVVYDGLACLGGGLIART